MREDQTRTDHDKLYVRMIGDSNNNNNDNVEKRQVLQPSQNFNAATSANTLRSDCGRTIVTPDTKPGIGTVFKNMTKESKLLTNPTCKQSDIVNTPLNDSKSIQSHSSRIHMTAEQGSLRGVNSRRNEKRQMKKKEQLKKLEMNQGSKTSLTHKNSSESLRGRRHRKSTQQKEEERESESQRVTRQKRAKDRQSSQLDRDQNSHCQTRNDFTKTESQSGSFKDQ